MLTFLIAPVFLICTNIEQKLASQIETLLHSCVSKKQFRCTHSLHSFTHNIASVPPPTEHIRALSFNWSKIDSRVKSSRVGIFLNNIHSALFKTTCFESSLKRWGSPLFSAVGGLTQVKLEVYSSKWPSVVCKATGRMYTHCKGRIIPGRPLTFSPLATK